MKVKVVRKIPAAAVGGGAAFDYYISTTGSDSNPGTLASPWAITAINTKRATYAGLSVGLMDGTYDTGSITPDTASISLGPASGTAGNPTIIGAVNPRLAVLDNGRVRPALMGRLDSTVAYIEFRDLKFINCTEFGIFLRNDTARIPGILIEGCEFTQQLRDDATDLTDAIFLQATDDAIVRNCKFHDIVNSLQASSVSAIIQYGTKRSVIERCTFDTVYAGMHSKYAGGSPRTDDQETTVRQCYFKGNQIACRGFDNRDQTSTAPTSPPYGAYIIENNVFEDNVVVLGNDGAFSSSSPIIARNNTIYWRSAGSKQGFNLYTRASGLGEPLVYNNIWSIGGSSTWTELRAMAITINGSGAALTGVIDYNCYHGAMEWTTQTGYGYPYYGGALDSPNSQASWQSATGVDDGALFATDPDFVLTGSNAARFVLDAGSPCLSAGHVGGVSGGAARHIGAWDGVVAQIGSDF